MNKILICIIGLVLLQSCGTSKAVRESKKTIKGEWILNTITYSETGVYKVNLLKDASKECFEGSNWQFIPNNNTGSYAIAGENCATGTRNFVFSIEDAATTGIQSFLLKPTNKKNKSESNEGFRLQLAQLSTASMQLQQMVTVDGKPFEINMNFTKK